MKRLLLVVIIGTSIIVVVSFLFFKYNPSKDTLTRIQTEDTIRIGYAVEAPYAYVDNKGEITGESPEVAKRIVENMEIDHIQWVQTDFGSLITGLIEEQYDVVASGLFITPERAKTVIFSEPTFHVRESLLVLKGNPDQIHSYDQLRGLPDIKIAVIQGAGDTILKSGVTSDRIILVPDALTGRVAVEAGVVDCLALSSITIQWMASHDQLGKTEVATPFYLSAISTDEKIGYGGFAFRLQDQTLADTWNKAQKSYIGSDAHLELIQRFGFSKEDLPGQMTTQEILLQK